MAESFCDQAPSIHLSAPRLLRRIFVFIKNATSFLEPVSNRYYTVNCHHQGLVSATAPESMSLLQPNIIIPNHPVLHHRYHQDVSSIWQANQFSLITNVSFQRHTTMFHQSYLLSYCYHYIIVSSVGWFPTSSLSLNRGSKLISLSVDYVAGNPHQDCDISCCIILYRAQHSSINWPLIDSPSGKSVPMPLFYPLALDPVRFLVCRSTELLMLASYLRIRGNWATCAGTPSDLSSVDSPFCRIIEHPSSIPSVELSSAPSTNKHLLHLCRYRPRQACLYFQASAKCRLSWLVISKCSRLRLSRLLAGWWYHFSIHWLSIGSTFWLHRMPAGFSSCKKIPRRSFGIQRASFIYHWLSHRSLSQVWKYIQPSSSSVLLITQVLESGVEIYPTLIIVGTPDLGLRGSFYHFWLQNDTVLRYPQWESDTHLSTSVSTVPTARWHCASFRWHGASLSKTRVVCTTADRKMTLAILYRRLSLLCYPSSRVTT